MLLLIKLVAYPEKHMKCYRLDSSDSRMCVISGFHLEIAEKCALLGYYAASSCNFLPKFRYIGPGGLSRNVCKKWLLTT